MKDVATPVFEWPVRVYYEDTDAGGVVYYANYLKYMERARTEYLRSLGIEQDQLAEGTRCLFMVRKIALDYLSPARFNELLSVRSLVSDFKRASLRFEQSVGRLDNQGHWQALCTAQVTIACVNADSGKPCAIPNEVREAFNP